MNTPLIAFPNAIWTDLFSSRKPYTDKSMEIASVDPWDGDKDAPCVLSSYCGSTKGRGMNVTPTPAVVEYFREQVLHVPCDTLSFKLVYRECDNTVLVVMQHSQIIGSHWLAILKPEDVPFVWLRSDYMGKNCSHEDYYWSLAKTAGVSYTNADPAFLARVRDCLDSGDKHLSNIPLGSWDCRAMSLRGFGVAAKMHGDIDSPCTRVCTIKEAARRAVCNR